MYEGVMDAEWVAQKFEKFINDKGEIKTRRTWMCPFYNAWAPLMQRCFDKKFKESCPTYSEVTCCEEWKSFRKFAKWMETKEWDGRHLDKDIIVRGNKVYSPETCAFVWKDTNKFVLENESRRGLWPIGVSWHKPLSKFRAQCNNILKGKPQHLGYFDTPEEAHEAWRKRKHELAQLVATTETDPRVVEALKKRYSVEEWYK